MRDAPYSEPPRKRYRSSHSPTSSHAFHASQHDHLPPSPYSSSERSDSGDYSPRSRGSMAIGSLLSSRPSRALNGDES
ncbi:hypothetical protein L208DRAFT_1407640 [Tricholoma matsutake]|nr:hypothetical protein L208DRAFT_1407640 [Tricholoma matsutake 945]